FARSGLYEGAFTGKLISAIAVATFVAGPVFVGWTLMNSYRENGPHNLLSMSLRLWAALIFVGTLLYFLVLG
ncbi:MAG: hypothetical protein PVI23_09250, partial [Maricaulaceae bacterium]